jgi:hypothetical protein
MHYPVFTHNRRKHSDEDFNTNDASTPTLVPLLALLLVLALVNLIIK